MWRGLGAQPRGLLVFSGRVSPSLLFILALPSLHWPLDRRAFFLSSLVLSSVSFCMTTFLPDWNGFLKNTECKGAPPPLNNKI